MFSVFCFLWKKGTGILLSVTIIYQFYEAFQKEQQEEMGAFGF